MDKPSLKQHITKILDVSAEDVGLDHLEETHLQNLLEALKQLCVQNMRSSRDQLSAIETLLNKEETLGQGIALLNSLDDIEMWETVCGHFSVTEDGRFESSKGPAGMGDLLTWIASPFSKKEPRTPLNISENRKSKNITGWPVGWEAILKDVDRDALTNFPKLDYPYSLHRIPNLHLTGQSLPHGGQLVSFRYGPYGSIRDINIFSRSPALEELAVSPPVGAVHLRVVVQRELLRVVLELVVPVAHRHQRVAAVGKGLVVSFDYEKGQKARLPDAWRAGRCRHDRVRRSAVSLRRL